jgi:GTPase SAR1 family protein
MRLSLLLFLAYPPHLPPLISYLPSECALGFTWNPDSDLVVKIVIIGDYSAGKTWLQTRLVSDSPQMMEENTASHGAEFLIKIVYFKGYKVKLQIWDSCMN